MSRCKHDNSLDLAKSHLREALSLVTEVEHATLEESVYSDAYEKAISESVSLIVQAIKKLAGK